MGIPYSPVTGEPIKAQQISEMVDKLLILPEDSRVYLLAPIVRDRKGEYKKEFKDLQKKGFQRVKVDGEYLEIQDVKPLDRNFRHNIDVVVDRIIVKNDVGQRIADSLRTALELADGIAVAEVIKDNVEKENIVFSENFSCPVSGFSIPEIEPRLFSFNAPYGACPDCDGLGVELFFDELLVVPNNELNLIEGAIAPWARSKSPYVKQTIYSLSRHLKFDPSTPWKLLDKEVKETVLYGSKDVEIKFEYNEDGKSYEVKRKFEGIIPN